MAEKATLLDRDDSREDDNPKFLQPHPRVAPGRHIHRDIRTFKVEVSGVEDEIYESIHVQHSVGELCSLVETSWSILHKTQEDCQTISVSELFCLEHEKLDKYKEIGNYYGDERYHPQTMQDAILLYAECTTPKDDIPNESRDVQQPSEESTNHTHEITPEIIPAPALPQQGNAEVHAEEMDAVGKANVSTQKAFFWISSLACLRNPDSNVAKTMVYAGRILIILLMLTYIFYLVWNPHHQKWWSNSGDVMTHIYYAIEGTYFLLMYVVAIRLFSLRHMEDIFERTPFTVLGLNNKWPEISRFVTKCALGGIFIITLPAVVLIHGLVLKDCRTALSIETKELINTTVPVEFTAYALFSFVNLPVFLYIILMVQIHTAALDKYADWLLRCTDPLQTAQHRFRTIQRRLKDSSKVLHWPLSFIFLLLLVWVSVSMWHTVYSWELEYQPNLFHVNKTGCLFPPAASRSTLITVTQLAFFYVYPLYSISKIPQRIRKLVEEVHVFPCQEQFLLRDEIMKGKVLAVLQSGLKIVPRFTVFRRIPISSMSTMVLLVLTPLVTVIWTTVIQVNYRWS